MCKCVLLPPGVNPIHLNNNNSNNKETHIPFIFIKKPTIYRYLNFSLTYFFQLPNGSGVYSASNRNEYQEYILVVMVIDE
jgi:hypothetical protein